MSVGPENPPRNFREVAMILHQITQDLVEIKAKQNRIASIAFGAFITVVTGVFTALVVSMFNG